MNLNVSDGLSTNNTTRFERSRGETPIIRTTYESGKACLKTGTRLHAFPYHWIHDNWRQTDEGLKMVLNNTETQCKKKADEPSGLVIRYDSSSLFSLAVDNRWDFEWSLHLAASRQIAGRSLASEKPLIFRQGRNAGTIDGDLPCLEWRNWHTGLIIQKI